MLNHKIHFFNATADHRNRSWFRLFLGISILLAVGGLMATKAKADDQAPMVVVRLQPSAEISGPDIRLHEIAVISAPPALATAIGSLKVARSPQPGLKRLLPRVKISTLLNSQRCPAARLVVKGPDFIQVYRTSQAMTVEHLREVIQRYVDQKILNAEFKLGGITIHGKNNFPVGRLQAVVVRHNTDELIGKVKFVLAVTVDDHKAGRAYASAWIDRYENVVVAKHALSRNSLIAESDLALQKMNISRTPASICMRLEDAVGKQIKQSINAGNYLRLTMLETPPTIYKGDRVTIIAERGPLQISAMGLAQTDGFMDEQIRVRNISSKRVVVGRVVDGSTVAVNF